MRKLFRGKESADQREGREPLSKAKEIAEDWYLQLRGKLRAGEIKSEKTFREVSEQYLHEYDIITQGQRKQAICGWPALAIERSLGPLFRELGHLRAHLRKDPGIPNSQTPGSNYETWQAAARERSAVPHLRDILKRVCPPVLLAHVSHEEQENDLLQFNVSSRCARMYAEEVCNIHEDKLALRMR